MKSKILNHIENQLPFVIYRKPNSNTIVGFFQKNNDLVTTDNMTENGFVFANFLNNQKILFDETLCQVITQPYTPTNNNNDWATTPAPQYPTQTKHETLVQNAINAINAQQLSKVVLSTTVSCPIINHSEYYYFQNILLLYPTAFCYWFYHPKVGQWMGATPEQLLKKVNNQIHTVSLAGTQAYDNQKTIHWGEKEKHEQQIVTNFIVEELQKVASEVNHTEPYTVRIGNLLHLKSDISAQIGNHSNAFQEILKALHPTPALCGMPKKEAQEYIIKHEGYNRQFYSGYLGEINKNFETNQDHQSNLFVNLRCMQIQHNTATIYVGGGITQSSSPTAEYIEIINKSKMMLKAIQQKRVIDN